MPRSGPQEKGSTLADIKQAEGLIYQILDSEEPGERMALLKERVGLTAFFRAMFMGWRSGDFNDFYAREIKPVDEALKALGQTSDQINNIGEAMGRIANYHDGEDRIGTILERTGYTEE